MTVHTKAVEATENKNDIRYTDGSTDHPKSTKTRRTVLQIR